MMKYLTKIGDGNHQTQVREKYTGVVHLQKLSNQRMLRKKMIVPILIVRTREC